MHKLTIDFQHCRIDAKRVDETINDGVPDLPTPDVHHRILRHELQPRILERSNQQWSHLFLADRYSDDNLHHLIVDVFVYSEVDGYVESTGGEEGG